MVFADLESPESEKLTDSVSEKEEKEEEREEREDSGPVRRRHKRRDTLPAGWERHEVREHDVEHLACYKLICIFITSSLLYRFVCIN